MRPFDPHLRVLACLAIVAAALVPFTSQAQTNFPNKPIRIIATLSPGSQVDILTRLLAEKVGQTLGQQVIIDNRVGAGGSIAAGLVAAAPADGYTLLATANGHVINPSLYAKLPFDTRKGFSGVSLIGVVPSMLVAAPSKPFRSLGELIAAAKARPGSLSYASAGVGSASHLAVELFRSLSGIDAVHVPYKGSADAIGDLVSGRVDFSFAPVGSTLALVKDGKARALAVTTAERAALLPDVPTFDEAGVKGYRFDFWYAVLAPAGTPSPVMAKLAEAFQQALALPDIREKFAAQGVIGSRISPPLTRAALDQFIAGEIDRYAVLVKQSGAKAD